VRHALDFSFGARHLATVAASAPVPLEQPADALRAEMQAVEPQREPVGAAAATAPPGGGLATVPDTAAPPRPAPAAVAARPARGRGGLAGAARGLIALAGRLDRSSKGRWLKRIVVLPIGERFALISVTAALFNPRVTFIALLAWGGFAAAYSLAGRFARSVAA
jgi:hypothetical protein